MLLNRRAVLQASAGAVATSLLGETASSLGIPGPYRGKVVAVEHSKSVVKGAYAAEPIRAMLSRAMCELTGAQQPADAWRRFFDPADVVGIKISPVGQPFVCSSPQMLSAIFEGLQLAGVPLANIVVYERYAEILRNAGIARWLPPGVRLAHASPAFSNLQENIEGYDPEHFVEFPFTHPSSPNAASPAARRSYAAQFITRQVTKLINLPVLKTHGAAGVTLSLKNLSHGLVNNVSRSHDGPQVRIAEFTPAVVALPVIRQKTVLNILDATKSIYHGGPGIMNEEFLWEPKTIYVGTDPVAVDRIGWSVLDAYRKKKRMRPVGDPHTDEVWKSPQRQPQHIERAGEAGLGEADLSKIDLKSIKLA